MAARTANCLIDVITSDPTIPSMCPRGAIQTGAAAEVAALSKERAWIVKAEAQGEAFYPLSIEAGGTFYARFHEFLEIPGLSRNGASLPSPTPHVNIAERPPQPPGLSCRVMDVNLDIKI